MVTKIMSLEILQDGITLIPYTEKNHSVSLSHLSMPTIPPSQIVGYAAIVISHLLELPFQTGKSRRCETCILAVAVGELSINIELEMFIYKH